MSEPWQGPSRCSYEHTYGEPETLPERFELGIVFPLIYTST